MLKTDRSLLKYIIFSILTCGIYGLIFLNDLSKDINVVADGDGETTPGVLKLILLSLVTCGIYSFIWYYNLGNRMVNAGGKYGVTVNESGTTILLWFLFGAVLCGIGPYVAMYFIIKNMNALCEAYNTRH